ncbi:MAG TPA: endonuclease/exonuclease/phosphatase family protein [Solirubrobacteraceae bacterium]
MAPRVVLVALVLALAGTAPAIAKSGTDARFATFNASLNRAAPGALIADLSNPGANTVGVRQARNVAEVIQRAAPDVVLINEFDYVAGGQAAQLFRDKFLAVSQQGAPAADYPYFFVAPSNTGIPSGFDLDNSGDGDPNDSGNDAFGFGVFPGQYGMVVFSKHPIDTAAVRTFQRFLWKDMPGARLPDDPATPAPADWYSPAELAVVRLSSKSHWDVPIRIGKRVVHFLVSHPTPPVFDGVEDRNGTRNADEIRLTADYVTPGRGGYIYDDAGRRGGLDPSALFVIAGDQNADPLDGDSLRDAAGKPVAAQQLLDNPRVNAGSAPASAGAVEAAALQGGANAAHLGDPAEDTADFSDTAPGNLRAD